MGERIGEFFGSTESYQRMTLRDYLVCYSFDIAEIMAAFREAVGGAPLAPRHRRTDATQAEAGAPYSHRVGFIGDVRGLRLSVALRMLGFVRTLAAEAERHFVEISAPIHLIHCSSFAVRAYDVVKAFLDPSLTRNIRMYAASDQSWRDALLAEFGPEVVPVELGG